MQNDLISRSALIAHIGDLGSDPEDDTTFLAMGQACAIAHKRIVDMVKATPAVDAVSRQAFDQILWELDIARQQLKEHNIPFGGIAPDVVEVIRCRDCVYYKQNPYNCEDIDLMCQCWADWLPTGDDDFCSYGERKAENG